MFHFLNLKWQCHEIFWQFFISLIQPIWPPNKKAKTDFLRNSFSRRYSNVKFETFDSAQANTAPTKSLHKMLAYNSIVTLYLKKKLIFSMKTRRGLHRQNCENCENDFLRKNILTVYQGTRWVRVIRKKGD